MVVILFGRSFKRTRLGGGLKDIFCVHPYFSGEIIYPNLTEHIFQVG